MAYLIVEFGGQRRELRIPGSPVTIGRQRDCTLTFDDDKLSREHARVFFDGRAYVVENLESKNGVYLNDELVERTRMLRPGDRIRAGGVAMEFRLDESDANLPPDARGIAPTPTPAPAPPPSAPPRLAVSAAARAAAIPVGPGPMARLFLALLLLAIFGAGVFGFRLAFSWAFDRMASP